MGEGEDVLSKAIWTAGMVTAPQPSDNRSRAYKHGFQSGRDDLARKPSAPFAVRLALAEEILREDEQFLK